MASAYSTVMSEFDYNKIHARNLVETDKLKDESRVYFKSILIVVILILPCQFYSIHINNKDEVAALRHLLELSMTENKWMINSLREGTARNDFQVSIYEDEGLGVNMKCMDGDEKPANGGSGSKTSDRNSGASQPRTASIVHPSMGSEMESDGNVGGGSDGNDPPRKNICLGQCVNSQIPDIVTPVSHEQNGIPSDSFQEDAQEELNQTMTSPSESQPSQPTVDVEGISENDNLNVQNWSASTSEPENNSNPYGTTASFNAFQTGDLPMEIMLPPNDDSDKLSQTCSVDEEGNRANRPQENGFRVDNIPGEVASIYRPNENLDQRPTSNYGQLEQRLLSFRISSEISSEGAGFSQAGSVSDLRCPSESGGLQSLSTLNGTLSTSEHHTREQSQYVVSQPRSDIQTLDISHEVQDQVNEMQVPTATPPTNQDQELDAASHLASNLPSDPSHSSNGSQVPTDTMPLNLLEESDASVPSSHLSSLDPENSSMAVNQSQESVYCSGDIEHETAVYISPDDALPHENCAVPVPSGVQEIHPVGASNFIFPMRREVGQIRFDVPATNLSAEDYPYIWGCSQSPGQNRLYFHPPGEHTF